VIIDPSLGFQLRLFGRKYFLNADLTISIPMAVTA
jgi:hypothetical protein